MNKTAYFSFSCDFSFHDTFRQLTNDNVPEISDSIFHPIRQAWKSTGASYQLDNVVYDYEGVDYAVDNAHGDIYYDEVYVSHVLLILLGKLFWQVGKLFWQGK